MSNSTAKRISKRTARHYPRPTPAQFMQQLGQIAMLPDGDLDTTTLDGLFIMLLRNATGPMDWATWIAREYLPPGTPTQPFVDALLMRFQFVRPPANVVDFGAAKRRRDLERRREDQKGR